MSSKTPRIATLIAACQGQHLDPHYLGFFECFNGERYFEAHEVLEELWLEDRYGPNGAFYKGLIQLAGAFVHLQKGRSGPATALLKLAEANLGRYDGLHEALDVQGGLGLIRSWLTRLENAGPGENPFAEQRPRLELQGGSPGHPW
jgi:predicted metal-dependent hydrolase